MSKSHLVQQQPLLRRNPQKTDNTIQKEGFTQTSSRKKNYGEGEKTEYTMEFRVNICSQYRENWAYYGII